MRNSFSAFVNSKFDVMEFAVCQFFNGFLMNVSDNIIVKEDGAKV